MQKGMTRTPAFGVLMMFVLVSSGCATRMFESRDAGYASFIGRSVTEVSGNVRISAAVPTAEEIVSITGLDLYEKGIQPVWLEVENNDNRQMRVALLSIDDEYYSPMEVAWAYRKGFSREGRAVMERWFYEHQMPRTIPPGEIRSGLVFTHFVEGTKGFNVDTYTSNESFNFTFFVPMPGFRPDYMDVRFDDLYEADDIQSVDLPGLRRLLADYACCSHDSKGSANGDPFNVVIVATPVALRRALLRSQWQETQAGSPESALARLHYYQGRTPDGTFYKSRPDGSERKELRVWLSPIRVADVPVWLAQASYDISRTRNDRSFGDYQIDPDVDDARLFVLQSFWYSQSLARFAMATGVPAASIDTPRRNFIGNTWFTDGDRIVLVVSERPVAMDETDILIWEKFLD
jgi:hypothetical protein